MEEGAGTKKQQVDLLVDCHYAVVYEENCC
jgi:hypothetical protein